MDSLNIDLDSLPGPESVTRYRAERYTGEDEAAKVDDFCDEDRTLLLRLYELLTNVLEETQSIIKEVETSGQLRALDQSLVSEWMDILPSFSKTFGSHRRQGNVSRAIYHDIRGGALTLADLRIQTMPLDELPPSESVYSLFYAARDHLKIMRNCVSDIDPNRREQDRRSNTHSMSLLRQKWNAQHSNGLHIDFVSDYDGPISSSCLEFSSLDRVLYNMVNNAANHTTNGRVRLFAKQIGDSNYGDIRFVTANPVAQREATTLIERFADDLGGLFLSDFTIGGTGVGLQIVREIVANAYGITDAVNVVKNGYVGATIRGTTFFSWSHWPVME